MTASRLLPVLRDIERAASLSLADWDDVVRLARQARLLGLIAHRLQDRPDAWARVPPAVRGHLQASLNYSAHRAQAVRFELDAVSRALPAKMRVVVLKGAAYMLQGLEFARGRVPNDVDLLVARHDLDAAEQALRAAGWQSEVTDDYDQRYYREWSHELPPMRFPGHALEVDLHHTISPVTSRIRVDDELLFHDVRALADEAYAVLHPLDQVIHAAIHLFQDSDLNGRLRDLVDIAGLVEAAVASDDDGSELVRRTQRHGAQEAVWYALHYCRHWLGAPIPADLPLAAPSSWRVRGFDWIFRRTSLPGLPGASPSPGTGLALRLGTLRYHRRRMPMGLLVRHALTKTWRRAARREP